MGVRVSGFAVCSQPIDGAGRNTWIVCMPPMGRPCFCMFLLFRMFGKHCMSGFYFEIPSLDVMTV